MNPVLLILWLCFPGILHHSGSYKSFFSPFYWGSTFLPKFWLCVFASVCISCWRKTFFFENFIYLFVCLYVCLLNNAASIYLRISILDLSVLTEQDCSVDLDESIHLQIQFELGANSMHIKPTHWHSPTLLDS